MKPVSVWLDEYAESHQHPFNVIIHTICVPLIMLSLVSLLSTISIDSVLLQNFYNLNHLGTVLMLLALVYYFFLSIPFFAGMIPVTIMLILGTQWLGSFSIPLWQLSLIIFVAAWIGQFYGHKVEGKKPSFFKDLQFLLIGPLWLLSKLYRYYGITY